MSVSQPIIAASSLSRRAVKTVAIPVTSTAPPGGRFVVVDGAVTAIDQNPKREGQLLAYQAPGENLIADLYVVVMDGGELRWVPVLPAVIPTDPRSGKPKDPLYDLYGLYS